MHGKQGQTELGVEKTRLDERDTARGEARGDVVLERGVVGEILEGTKDVAWRPLDGTHHRPNLLKSGRAVPGHLEAEVMAKHGTYEMTDAEGENVGAAEFFTIFGPILE